MFNSNTSGSVTLLQEVEKIKMKKWTAFLLALVMCLSLCACGKGGDTEDSDRKEKVKENPYEELEQCAEYAADKVKSAAHDPDSVVILEITAVDHEGDYVFNIQCRLNDINGNNDFASVYLSVGKDGNSFTTNTYGRGQLFGDENQAISYQIYKRESKDYGYYEFDTYSYRMVEFHAVEHEYVDVEGCLQGKSDEYDGAWMFSKDGNSKAVPVYFADGVDLSGFKENGGAPGERITIHAYKTSDGYHDATIVRVGEDISVEDRLARFNSGDRNFFKDYVQDMEAMTEDEVRAELTGQTFSMRNNFGGDVDGTHSITFNGDNTLNAKYTYGGKENTMFETWRIENEAVILTTPKGTEITLTPYQYDKTHILLIDAAGDYSMVLTA